MRCRWWPPVNDDLDRKLAEVQALADTLRAAIDSLNARELDAEDNLFRRAHQWGQALRGRMLGSAPAEAYDFIAGLPDETWTASAADLLSKMYAEVAKQEGERREQQRG